VHAAQASDRGQIKQADLRRQVIVDIFDDALESPFLQFPNWASLRRQIACVGRGSKVRKACKPDSDGTAQRIRAGAVATLFGGFQGRAQGSHDAIFWFYRKTRAKIVAESISIRTDLDGLKRGIDE
jgi:hypothetical protein